MNNIFENNNKNNFVQVFNTLEDGLINPPVDFINTVLFKRLMQGLISRNPKKLIYHIQYIHGLLTRTTKDSDLIASSLVDLFIILEKSGLSLKKRLLKYASPVLDPEVLFFLENSISNGINCNTRLPKNLYSILTSSIIGDIGFIGKRKI